MLKAALLLLRSSKNHVGAILSSPTGFRRALAAHGSSWQHLADLLDFIVFDELLCCARLFSFVFSSQKWLLGHPGALGGNLTFTEPSGKHLERSWQAVRGSEMLLERTVAADDGFPGAKSASEPAADQHQRRQIGGRAPPPPLRPHGLRSQES